MEVIQTIIEVNLSGFYFLIDQAALILSRNHFWIIFMILSIVWLGKYLFSDFRRKKLYALSIGWQVFNRNKVPNGLKILVNGLEVNNLGLTHFSVFNPQSYPVMYSDVKAESTEDVNVKIDSDYKIYDAKILYLSGRKAYFKIIKGDANIKISFKKLFKNDGLILRIYHSTNDHKFNEELHEIGLINHSGSSHLDLIGNNNDGDFLKIYHNMKKLKRSEKVNALMTSISMILFVHLYLYSKSGLDTYIDISSFFFLKNLVIAHLLVSIFYLMKSIKRTDYKYYKRLNIENQYLELQDIV